MLLAILDNDEADLISEAGLLFIQPIIGSIIIAITIFICLAVGLPIRLITRLKKWWIDRPIIPIIGLTSGVMLLLLSFYPSLMDQKEIVLNGEPKLKQIPNIPLSMAGWFLVAFSLLHFYPKAFIQLIIRMSERFFRKKEIL